MTQRGRVVETVVVGVAFALVVWTIGASLASSSSGPETTGVRVLWSTYVMVEAPDGWAASLKGPTRILDASVGPRAYFSSDLDRGCDARVLIFIDRTPSPASDSLSYPERSTIDEHSGTGFAKGDELPCSKSQGIGFEENGWFYSVNVTRGGAARAADLDAAYRILNSMSLK